MQVLHTSTEAPDVRTLFSIQVNDGAGCVYDLLPAVNQGAGFITGATGGSEAAYVDLLTYFNDVKATSVLVTRIATNTFRFEAPLAFAPCACATSNIQVTSVPNGIGDYYTATKQGSGCCVPPLPPFNNEECEGVIVEHTKFIINVNESVVGFVPPTPVAFYIGIGITVGVVVTSGASAETTAMAIEAAVLSTDPTAIVTRTGTAVEVQLYDPEGIYCNYPSTFTLPPGNSPSFLTVTSGECCYNTPTPSCNNVVSIFYEQGSTPTEINFAAVVSNNTNVIGWAWNFGDSNTSTLENPTHIYASTGTYTVQLCILTNNGCDQCVTRQINVPCQEDQNLFKIEIDGTLYLPNVLSDLPEDLFVSNKIRFFVGEDCCGSPWNITMPAPWVLINPNTYELPGKFQVSMPEFNPAYTLWTSGFSNYLIITPLAPPPLAPFSALFEGVSLGCAGYNIGITTNWSPVPVSCSPSSTLMFGNLDANNFLPYVPYTGGWNPGEIDLVISGLTATFTVSLAAIEAHPRPGSAQVFFQLGIIPPACCTTCWNTVNTIPDSLTNHPEVFDNLTYDFLPGGYKRRSGIRVWHNFTQGYGNTCNANGNAGTFYLEKGGIIMPGTYIIANRILQCSSDPTVQFTANIILNVIP